MRFFTLSATILLTFLTSHAQFAYEHVYAIGNAGATLLGEDGSIYQWGTNGSTGTLVYGVKSDAAGNTVWQKQYAIAGLESNISVTEAKTDSTGTMVVLVRTWPGPDLCLLSIDTGGTVLSADVYSPPAPFAAIDMTLDTQGNRYVTSDHFRVMKISAAGDVVWAKAFTNQGPIESGYGDDDIGGLLLRSTGTLLFSARSYRDLYDFQPSARQRLTLHELDTAGTLLQSWSWRDTLPNQSSWDIQPGKVLERPDGGLVVTGRISSTPFALQLDELHELQWMRIVESPYTNGQALRYDVALMADDRILFGQDLGSADDGLTMLSPQGTHLWSKRFHYTTLGAHIANLLPTPDGGVTWSGDRHLQWNANQLYLTHLDSTFSWPCYEHSYVLNNMVYDPVPQSATSYSTTVMQVTHVPALVIVTTVTEEANGCASTLVPSHELPTVVVRPSLADDHVLVDHPEADGALIQVIDAHGSVLFSERSRGASTRIVTSSLPAGVYMILCSDESRGWGRVRMIVAH